MASKKSAKKSGTTSNPNALHTLIARSYSACVSAAKAGISECAAFVLVVEAIALNDAASVKAARDDIFATYGEEHKDAAQIRVNILNNARRVAFGGMKDDKQVRGKGHSVMLEVLHSEDSIRELKRAMSEAVPEALKGVSGGDRKSTKGKGKGKDAKLIAIPKVANRGDAFRAAREVLAFVVKFLKPSETALTDAVAKCDALLSEAPNA